MPGYEASFWYGLLAPAGTPSAIVNVLNARMKEALADKAITQPLELQGLIAAPSSPKEFGDIIRRDYDKWTRTFAGKPTGIK